MSGYALLGSACMTSSRILSDASRYLPIDFDLYNLNETKFSTKPAELSPINVQIKPVKSGFSSCCGMK